MIVEDGTGLAAANAYVSEAELETYAEAHGLTLPTTDAETGIVRASAWVDAIYGPRFPGQRVNGRDQGLGWPRTHAYDDASELIPSDVVPVEVKNATCEAALREMTTVGILTPDIAVGPAVRRKSLGSMEIEYAVADGARATAPGFPKIDAIMAPLLWPLGGGGMIPLLRA